MGRPASRVPWEGRYHLFRGKAVITCSIGRPGTCPGNSVAETFFATLNVELIYRRPWPSRAEMVQVNFAYVGTWCDPHRWHGSFCCLSPVAFEASNPSAPSIPDPMTVREMGARPRAQRATITDTWRMLLPRVWYRGTNVAPVIASSPIGVGIRVFEGVVTSRDGFLHVDGTPSMQTASSWHTALLAFVAEAGTVMTLTDPAGTSWTVAIEEVEDRVSTGATTFGRAWETRLVWVEVPA